MELYLVCEDSLAGIFTGIYEAYLQKRPREEIHIEAGTGGNYRLFAEYLEIAPDAARAEKVARAIKEKMGEESFGMICRALATASEDKAEAVFRMVERALRMRNPAGIAGDLADKDVFRVFELSRFCGNEAHYYIEFSRFRELENGILYASIRPKNDVLSYVMPHFANRLPLENFVMHDVGRGYFGIHPAKKDWYMMEEEKNSLLDNAAFDSVTDYSEKESYYSELFRTFFKVIAIEDRANPKLQRNNLPLRYREFMTDFLQ